MKICREAPTIQSVTNFADFVHDILLYCSEGVLRQCAQRTLLTIARALGAEAALLEALASHGEICITAKHEHERRTYRRRSSSVTRLECSSAKRSCNAQLLRVLWSAVSTV